MHKIYNSAIIGLGKIGFLFDLDGKRKDTWTHLKAYTKCNRTNIAGVVEINKDIIKQFKSLYPEIPVYESVKDLFANQKIDIISICTPSETHFDVFNEISDFDVSAIFCEKPIATDMIQARSMITNAKDKKILLAINYSRRWESIFTRASQLVAKGRLGKIGKVRAITCFYSGQIINVGSHLLDLVTMFSKKAPILVSGISHNIDDQDPDISGWIKLEDNVICTLNCSNKKQNLIFEIDVIGDKGRVLVSENGHKIDFYVFKESKRYSPYQEPFLQKLKNIKKNDRFVDAVENIINVLEEKDKFINCSGKDGFNALAICDAFIKSAKENGKPVEVESA